MSNKLQFKTEVVLIFRKPLLWNAINKSVLYFAKKTPRFYKIFPKLGPILCKLSLHFTKHPLFYEKFRYCQLPFSSVTLINRIQKSNLWNASSQRCLVQFFFLQSIRRNKMSGPSMDFRKAVEMSDCQLGIKRRECLTAISVSIWKSFEFLTKWFHTCLRTMQK